MDASVQWIDKKSKEMPMGDMHFVVAGAGFVGLEMVEHLAPC
jgi:NADH dehydrogenase FAD-containing subunit